MTPNKNQRTLGELVKEIAPVFGLMIAIFTVLEIFLPTSLVQPLFALVSGFIFTVLLACTGKWNWGTMLITWLAVGIGLIILYLIVSRPATVMGAVVDSSGSPVVGLTLVLTDSDGVDHKAVTDENGAFEVRNVPEGKFTVLANGELLISTRVPSGWKRIIDSKTEVGALVHGPSPTATPVVVAVTPTNTPTATSIPPTSTSTPESATSTFTPTPIEIRTSTSTSTLASTLTPMPTNTPTPLAPPTATSTPIPIATSVRVDARMNIYGANKLTPPGPAGGGGGKLPAEISFPAQPGQTLIISSVEGEVSGYSDSCGYNGADGGPFCTGKTHMKDYEGISGIVHGDKTMFLVGVFLDNTGPTGPAPKTLGYTEETDDLEEVVSPLLNQVFFIGDGRTPNKTVQKFEIPPDATCLYLGFAESNDFGYSGNPGLPGYYDNGGGLTVSLEIRR